VGRARAKPTIVINFNDLVGAAKLYPPYKKNVFLLNLMALMSVSSVPDNLFKSLIVCDKKKNVLY